ncbi:MAG: putative Ig proteinputative calcium-binding proteinFG-GAP repeat protein, partial [Nocardioides sp.]|nr:putative Ig proteinputative calcium-binding proteinFG-GAP repeat protein [Nocardioides sp.]
MLTLRSMRTSIGSRGRLTAILLLAFGLVPCLASSAQAANGIFDPQATYTTGSSPYSVAVGDFDGDGDPDLAVANYGADSVSVLLGTAGGGFAAKTDYPTGAYPQSVAVGDFNGDADPDLAVANYYSHSVSVLLGTAGGGFAAKTDYPSGDTPYSVAVGDFNGDADPDLAVTNASVSSVSVLLGTAGGGFAAQTDYPTGVNPRSVAVGDFNGDADPDLAVANAGADSVSVLLGTAGGGFAAKTDYPTGSGPISVAVGDFDGDADPDLAVANFFSSSVSSSVSVLLGTAGGGFAAKTDYPTGSGPNSVVVGDAFSVAVGDFNGDADRDLAVANSRSNSVSVLLGTAGGGFAAKTDYPTGAHPLSVAVGDFNGDADPDLALANANAGSVSVLLGTTPVPVFSVSPTTKAYGTQVTGTTSSAQTFTVTNTGTADLAIATATLAGTDAAQFTKGSDTCTGQSVAPAATCTVQVSFAPGSVGAKAATLRFTDDATGSPHDVTLSGTGTAPVFSVSPTTKAYGTQAIGTTGAGQTFTVTNTGTAALAIATATLAGTDAAQFTKGSDTCTGASVAPAATCTVAVSFAPGSAVGAKAATLRFTDDAAGGPHDVALSGTGTAPVFSVSPTTKAYGTQAIGTTSAGQTFTVTNTGTADLAITTATLAGADPGQFTKS